MLDVVCGIVKVEDKILVTQRSEKMKLPLKWEFPGGKIESGESEVECIKRELKEELNIEVEILKKLNNNIHDYGSFKVNLIPYLVKLVSGDIVLSEHKAFKILGKDDLYSIDWAEADFPIVKQIETEIL